MLKIYSKKFVTKKECVNEWVFFQVGGWVIEFRGEGGEFKIL